MRISIHTSFLRQEYCLTSVLGGLGGMRGDVRGVGNPLDASKVPSADLGNFSALFGMSQIHYPLFTKNSTHKQYTKYFGSLIHIHLYSPLFYRAFYVRAAVSLWADYHPEVRTREQEVWGIQGEETVGQTSLRAELCH